MKLHVFHCTSRSGLVTRRAKSGGKRAAVQTLRDQPRRVASAERLDCGGFSTALGRALQISLGVIFFALILFAYASATAAERTGSSAALAATGLIERLLPNLLITFLNT